MKTTIQKLSRYPAILSLFIKHPDRNLTPMEISKITNISYPTTWRYVHDIEKAGIIFIEKIGEYNICRLNKKSPLIKEIKGLIELELSPHRLAVKEFIRHVKKLKETDKVIMFGSIARGEEKLTSDVDIALLVNNKTEELEKQISIIVEDVLEKTKMRVIPIILTKDEKIDKQFAEELRKGQVLYARAKRS